MQFRTLPGNPPDDKIIGKLKDGRDVTVGAVETVFNDREFIDSVHGKGSYEKVAIPVELEVLAIADKLFEP